MKVDEQGRFITRCNVDNFFKQVMIPKKNILMSTISQYVGALYHEATRAEHPHPDKCHVKCIPVQLVLESYSNEKRNVLKTKWNGIMLNCEAMFYHKMTCGH